MSCSILRAAAVALLVAVLAATAGAASFVSAAPLPAVLLSSPPFLWIAANVIIVWLVSSYRHHRTAVAAVLSSSAGDVSAAMGGMLFPSSEHDVFAAAPDAVVVPVPVLVSRPWEARTAKRPTDRPRVRKKPAGEGKVGGVASAEAKPVGKKEQSEQEEKPRASAAATEDEAVGIDDVSMDSAWQSIVRRGAAQPVAVRKSETWGGEELPRMRRAADKAVATTPRREMRKSATMVPPSPPHPAAGSSPVAAKQGWRTRDVLVMAQDELLRRAESFIRRQHEHLRIQRQESEQRQAMDMEHDRRRPNPIRV